MNTPHRRAFTLVELLVVIAIIGVLIALTLPGIMGARESARRTQCVHGMTQLSLGLHHFEMAHEHFPSGSIHSNQPGKKCGARRPSNLDYSTAALH